MKRTAISLMLAICCAASFAQVNPRMSELFDLLAASGNAPHICKTGGRNDPTRLTYLVHLYHRPDLWSGDKDAVTDSLRQEDRKKLDRQVAAVRHTLDALQEESQESYHYETHRGGKDTIIYAMNLSHDTTWVAKVQQDSHPHFYSKEYLSFQYQPEGKGYGSCLEYVIATPKERTADESALCSIDDLMAGIDRLFKQHRIKPRKAYWEHDEAYSDSIWEDTGAEFLEMGSYGDEYSLAGTSDVNIYTVPAEQEQLAVGLLAAVDSLMQDFMERPREYFFQYNAGTKFKENFLHNIMICLAKENVTERQFSIQVMLWGSGYHFMLIDTKGTEWVPMRCVSLKSFVNGKKTYFKGMEPK
ncbi:MAG: hypothetical protein J5733_09605 [Bacteroidaceae bacterium]|nr:hypothetical protein [Bacteroidaceae bacterium]